MAFLPITFAAMRSPIAVLCLLLLGCEQSLPVAFSPPVDDSSEMERDGGVPDGAEAAAVCVDRCDALPVFPGTSVYHPASLQPLEPVKDGAGTPKLPPTACIAEPAPNFSSQPCAVFEFRPDGTLSKLQRFDPSGRPLVDYSKAEDGGTKQVTRTYDSYGVKTQITEWNDTAMQHEEWERDEAGRTLLYQRGGLPDFVQTARFFYGEAGELDHVDYEGSYHGWGGPATERYLYDGGHLVSVLGELRGTELVAETHFSHHADGGIASRTTTTYRPLGRTTETENRDEAGRVTMRRQEDRHSSSSGSSEYQLTDWFPQASGWHDVWRLVVESCGSRSCSSTTSGGRALLDESSNELLRYNTSGTSRHTTRTTHLCKSALLRVKESDLHDDGTVDSRTDYQHSIDGQTLIVHVFQDGQPTLIRVEHHPCSSQR